MLQNFLYRDLPTKPLSLLIGSNVVPLGQLTCAVCVKTPSRVGSFDLWAIVGFGFLSIRHASIIGGEGNRQRLGSMPSGANKVNLA